jgi:hypothetical protein
MGNAPRPFHKRLFDGWMRITARFGFVQTLVVLTLFYVFLLGPVATAFKISRSDLLAKRGLRSGPTAWCEADSAKPDLERAKLAS